MALILLLALSGRRQLLGDPEEEEAKRTRNVSGGGLCRLRVLRGLPKASKIATPCLFYFKIMTMTIGEVVMA